MKPAPRPLFTLFCTLLFCTLLAAKLAAHDFSNEPVETKKSDWVAGVLRLEVDYKSGAWDSIFAVKVDEKTLVTSSDIAHLGTIERANVKLRDADADLIICIATARLLASDTGAGLAAFEITGYTDDYCAPSKPKAYHLALLGAQTADFRRGFTPKGAANLAPDNPFLIDNYQPSIHYEDGFLHFDENGRFVGLCSGGKIIKTAQITRFLKSLEDKGLK